MTDLFSMLGVITKCLKYIRKIYATKLVFGVPIANALKDL